MATVVEDCREEEAMSDEVKQSAEVPLKVLNGLPMMYENEIFDGHFKIFERIGWDDTIGATYFAVDTKTRKELVLRIDRKDRSSVVKIENIFLTKVENVHKEMLFTQLHSSGIFKDFIYYAVYYRGGPSLEDCINFMKNKKMSHGTAARLACDILRVLDVTHSLGYLLRSLHPNMFYFDASWRKLFLFDLSTIQRDARKLKTHGGIKNKWRGGPHYAPISFHSENAISCRDELESLFYLLIEMVRGSLPWGSVRAELVADIKIETLITKTLFTGLPRQYAELYGEIEKLTAGDPIDYAHFEYLFQVIYSEVGGVRDLEENLDFERDPTEAELPKFVIKRGEEISQENDSGKIKEEMDKTQSDTASVNGDGGLELDVTQDSETSKSGSQM